MLTRILSGTVILIFILIVGVLLLSKFSVPGIDFKILVVQSGSMEPAIKTGSVVFVSPSDLYLKGDIITFRRESSQREIPITHRIVEVENINGEIAYAVKGDANKYIDTEQVLNSEVVGKVNFTTPYAGSLINAAKTPLGIIFLIIFPALLIVSEEIMKIRRKTVKNNFVIR